MALSRTIRLFQGGVSGILLLGFSVLAHSATANYADDVAFQSALTGGLTIIDTSVTGPNIGKTTAELSSQTVGAEFIGVPSFVRSDGLIPNGTFIVGGVVGLNFDPGVTGVGVTSNEGDGGRIKIFDGLDGTGNQIGEVLFGVGNGWISAFGGIIATQDIRSAIFTCEFDGDIKCGLIDPTFGKVAAVPIPAAAWLFASALLGLGTLKRWKA